MKKSFSERLRQGDRLYGTLVVSPSPLWPENMAKLGLDFVFIDTEHIALDREKLAWMCHTYRGYGLYPIVRILSPDPFLATRALDGGARGIIAPYVESPQQARDMVGAVKLNPVKGNKLQGFLSNKESPSPKLEKHLAKRNWQNTLILNIESVEGIQKMDEILDVEGVDGILIGPHDLSCSLDMPQDYRNPEFDKAVRQIIGKARSSGVGAGIHCVMGSDALDLEQRWIEAGANFVLHSADIIAAMETLKREIGLLKAGNVRAEDSEKESLDRPII